MNVGSFNKKTNRQEIWKVFCKKGLMVVRMDYPAIRSCKDYSPKMILCSPWCGVCEHKENLIDGKLTERQEQ